MRTGFINNYPYIADSNIVVALTKNNRLQTERLELLLPSRNRKRTRTSWGEISVNCVLS